jgi:hypothetical protein
MTEQTQPEQSNIRAHRIAVTRQHDDAQEVPGLGPMNVLRASIGGNDAIGYYLQFRGDPAKVVEMLEMMTAAAAQMLPAGRYKDER